MKDVNKNNCNHFTIMLYTLNLHSDEWQYISIKLEKKNSVHQKIISWVKKSKKLGAQICGIQKTNECLQIHYKGHLIQ